MINYSQHGEQAHILRYFGSEVGTFLDIGANDGRTFSNTYALALKGWKGVCVEPAPKAFENLAQTYAGREDIMCFERAITSADGRAKMQVASDTLVSSLDVQAPQIWKPYGFEWAEIEVEAMSFATLLSKSIYKTFDFINIDTEGHDLSILRQMDLDALGVRLLCIERGPHTDEIKDYCKGFHQLYANGINLILAR